MSVNGWMGLAYDLRRSAEVERQLDDRRRELEQLRRAARIARQTLPRPIEPGGPAELRRATVEAQQAILLHALRTGAVDLARHAARTLRVSDLAGEPGVIEGLLGVMRDSRSSDAEILEAAAELATRAPAGS